MKGLFFLQLKAFDWAILFQDKRSNQEIVARISLSFFVTDAILRKRQHDWQFKKNAAS